MIVQWWTRRSELTERRHALKIARLDALIAVAPFQAKADIEWDMKWTRDLGGSAGWKETLLFFLMTLPLVGLFIPGLQGPVSDAFKLMKDIHPDAPSYFMAGWGVIFAATFGFRKAFSSLLPAKVTSLVGALRGLKDDVPDEAVNIHTTPSKE